MFQRKKNESKSGLASLFIISMMCVNSMLVTFHNLFNISPSAKESKVESIELLLFLTSRVLILGESLPFNGKAKKNVHWE